MTALAVVATGCTARGSAAGPPSIPVVEAEAESPTPAETERERGALLPTVAVATAVQAAQQAPQGRWTMSTSAEFLDGSVRQSVAAHKRFDRTLDRSELSVDVDLVDRRRAATGSGLANPFEGLTTEITRAGDEVLVRLSSDDTPDQDWHALGNTDLTQLPAWEYLPVDPLGERLPLLGFLDSGPIVDTGIVDGQVVTYPFRLPGEVVVSQLSREAPTIAEWLPDLLAADVLDAVAPGMIVIDNGQLVEVRIDLGPVMAAIAAGFDGDFDQAFYESADVSLRVAFDLDDDVRIDLPPPSTVVQPAPIIEDIPSDDLMVGDCLAAGTDLRLPVLPLVSCADSHSLEVFVVDPGWSAADAYPGRMEIRRRADELCVAAFAPFVGARFDESIHSLATITPLPEGWEAGDRTIICLAEAYLPVRGSLAGVGA